MKSVDREREIALWKGEPWDDVRKALRTACRRCDGVGLTFWDAFRDGITNIFGHLVGDPVTTYCKRCDGTGREPQQGGGS